MPDAISEMIKKMVPPMVSVHYDVYSGSAHIMLMSQAGFKVERDIHPDDFQKYLNDLVGEAKLDLARLLRKTADELEK